MQSKLPRHPMEFHRMIWTNSLSEISDDALTHELLDFQDEESGWTGLHKSLYYGNLAIAAKLLGAGSRQRIQDKKGRYPVDLVSEAVRGTLQEEQGMLGLLSWGDGSNYQLGNGDTGQQPSPVRIEALPLHSRATAIAAAKFHSCAVTADGQLYTWGWGQGGRLGHDDPNVYSGEAAIMLPRAVQGLSKQAVAAVAAAKHHTIVATAAGEVFTWGSNRDGRLGYPAVDTQPTPRRVSSLSNRRVRLVAAANKHSVAATATGEVYCWGSNAQGQLGYGTQDGAYQSQPRIVEALKGRFVKAISAAKRHTLTLTQGGEILTWGHKVVVPRRVQLAGCRDTARSHPGQQVRYHRGHSEVYRPEPGQIAAGTCWSVCLTTQGVALAWWSADPKLKVQEVAGPLAARRCIAIAAGKERAAAVTETGDVYVWEPPKGYFQQPSSQGQKGQAAYGGQQPSIDPVRVDGGKRIVAVVVGEKHSLALQHWWVPALQDPAEARAGVESESSSSSSEQGLFQTELESSLGQLADDTWQDPQLQFSQYNIEDQETTQSRNVAEGQGGGSVQQLFRYRDGVRTLQSLAEEVLLTKVLEPRHAVGLLEASHQMGLEMLLQYSLSVVAFNLDGFLNDAQQCQDLAQLSPEVLGILEAAFKASLLNPSGVVCQGGGFGGAAALLSAPPTDQDLPWEMSPPNPNPTPMDPAIGPSTSLGSSLFGSSPLLARHIQETDTLLSGASATSLDPPQPFALPDGQPPSNPVHVSSYQSSQEAQASLGPSSLTRQGDLLQSGELGKVGESLAEHRLAQLLTKLGGGDMSERELQELVQQVPPLLSGRRPTAAAPRLKQQQLQPLAIGSLKVGSGAGEQQGQATDKEQGEVGRMQRYINRKIQQIVVLEDKLQQGQHLDAQQLVKVQQKAAFQDAQGALAGGASPRSVQSLLDQQATRSRQQYQQQQGQQRQQGQPPPIEAKASASSCPSPPSSTTKLDKRLARSKQAPSLAPNQMVDPQPPSTSGIPQLPPPNKSSQLPGSSIERGAAVYSGSGQQVKERPQPRSLLQDLDLVQPGSLGAGASAQGSSLTPSKARQLTQKGQLDLGRQLGAGRGSKQLGDAQGGEGRAVAAKGSSRRGKKVGLQTFLKGEATAAERAPAQAAGLPGGPSQGGEQQLDPQPAREARLGRHAWGRSPQEQTTAVIPLKSILAEQSAQQSHGSHPQQQPQPGVQQQQQQQGSAQAAAHSQAKPGVQPCPAQRRPQQGSLAWQKPQAGSSQQQPRHAPQPPEPKQKPSPASAVGAFVSTAQGTGSQGHAPMQDTDQQDLALPKGPTLSSFIKPKQAAKREQAQQIKSCAVPVSSLSLQAAAAKAAVTIQSKPKPSAKQAQVQEQPPPQPQPQAWGGSSLPQPSATSFTAIQQEQLQKLLQVRQAPGLAKPGGAQQLVQEPAAVGGSTPLLGSSPNALLKGSSPAQSRQQQYKQQWYIAEETPVRLLTAIQSEEAAAAVQLQQQREAQEEAERARREKQRLRRQRQRERQKQKQEMGGEGQRERQVQKQEVGEQGQRERQGQRQEQREEKQREHRGQRRGRGRRASGGQRHGQGRGGGQGEQAGTQAAEHVSQETLELLRANSSAVVQHVKERSGAREHGGEEEMQERQSNRHSNVIAKECQE